VHVTRAVERSGDKLSVKGPTCEPSSNGGLSERRALGPPSLGDVVVHTTPIAVPASATIGEPDIEGAGQRPREPVRAGACGPNGKYSPKGHP
jgi:hypothetical protein